LNKRIFRFKPRGIKKKKKLLNSHKSIDRMTINLVKKMNTKWGVILLGWLRDGEPLPFKEDLVIPKKFFGTYAYLLSNFGARKLLELHDKIEVQVDAFMSNNIKKIK
jgi:GR25 family glycosyltransferase involved in LPS biosynthesis